MTGLPELSPIEVQRLREVADAEVADVPHLCDLYHGDALDLEVAP